jgi:hypothetical protein
MMSNPLQNIIKRFENQIDTYQQSDYNEAQTRIDFVNPFLPHWAGMLIISKG